MAALFMHRASPLRKRFWLCLSLASNLGLLFSFKYFNFFNGELGSLFGYLGYSYPVPLLNVLLPVGISFYTFQTLSYTIDVYYGHIPPERNIARFALFVSFFPQLVAGPIERARNLLPQFHQEHSFSYQRAVTGSQYILWGMFMKVVVADRAAVYVDTVFNNVYVHDSPLTLLLATYLFAFQIYCDFCGYSYIAIGCARILGYDLMDNFRVPYLAQSIGEFWKRWHISLSTWFRDYVYIPLGGNRVSTIKWYRNILAVFVLSGLWHGANWTFIVWGTLHGCYMFGSALTARWRSKVVLSVKLQRYPLLLKALRILVTFHLVCFGWIFFRANSLTDALFVLSCFVRPSNFNLYIGDVSQLVYALFAVCIVIVFDSAQRYGTPDSVFSRRETPVRWAGYCLITLGILLLGVFDGGQFIYFQF